MGAPQIDDTQFPIGEVSFIEINQAVDAADMNGQLIEINCVLPVNYAYAMVEIYLSLFAGETQDADNWSEVAQCHFRSTSLGVPHIRRVTNFALVSPGEAGEFFGGREEFRSPFNGVVPKEIKNVPVGNRGNVNLEILWSNDSPNGAAANLAFSIRFVQYSIAIAQHATVNTPQLVR